VSVPKKTRVSEPWDMGERGKLPQRGSGGFEFGVL